MSRDLGGHSTKKKSHPTPSKCPLHTHLMITQTVSIPLHSHQACCVPWLGTPRQLEDCVLPHLISLCRKRQLFRRLAELPRQQVTSPYSCMILIISHMAARGQKEKHSALSLCSQALCMLSSLDSKQSSFKMTPVSIPQICVVRPKVRGHNQIAN